MFALDDADDDSKSKILEMNNQWNVFYFDKNINYSYLFEI
jgi:hypothetical protein